MILFPPSHLVSPAHMHAGFNTKINCHIPYETSSLPQEIRYFLLSANMCHIPLLLHSSWILLPSCHLDNIGSYLQFFRQWESKTFPPIFLCMKTFVLTINSTSGLLLLCVLSLFLTAPTQTGTQTLSPIL